MIFSKGVLESGREVQQNIYLSLLPYDSSTIHHYFIKSERASVAAHISAHESMVDYSFCCALSTSHCRQPGVLHRSIQIVPMDHK